MESRILLRIEIQNPSSTDKHWNQLPGIRNPWCGMQNPRLCLILLTYVVADPFTKTRKIYFKCDKVPFDGVPHMIIGSKIYDCQHGPDRKKNEKAKISCQKVTING